MTYRYTVECQHYQEFRITDQVQTADSDQSLTDADDVDYYISQSYTTVYTQRYCITICAHDAGAPVTRDTGSGIADG